MVEVLDWGLIDYKKAWESQLELLYTFHENQSPGALVFCSHPEVVTLGRATQQGDLGLWKGSVYEIDRGGRATYHYPGQLVIYPVFSLKHPFFKSHFKPKDILSFLEYLESAIIKTFLALDPSLTIEVKESESYSPSGQKLLNRGLWYGDFKVASIGIGVKRWISFHGVAINFKEDISKGFQKISPCGYESSVMRDLTSLGFNVSREDFKQHFSKHLKS